MAAALYFLVFLVAVIWPGMVPFNRVDPMVPGLPFNMVWILLWVIGSSVVFYLAERVEGKEPPEGGEREE